MRFSGISLFFQMITGSEYITKFLEYQNTNIIFGYSGGTNLDLLNKLSKSRIKIVTNRHEQFLGHSAEGYAKTSKKIGVALTTSGPGVTNMITPLQDSLSDSIPLVLISGQVSKKNLGTNAFQEVDAIELTKACTKWNYQVQDISELHYALHTGFSIALDGKKGPVHIDICKDVFTSDTKDFPENKIITEKILPFEPPIFFEYKKILNKIENSKKPIIIVGKGAFSCMGQIRKFSRLYNIPVTTTLHAVGLMDERKHLSLGMLGMHGTPYANKAVQEADLIIGIGNRFDDRTIGNPKTFGQNAKLNYGIVHIDIDMDNINMVKKIIEPTYSFKMKGSFFMDFLLRNSFQKKDIEWIESLRQKYPFPLEKNKSHLKMEDILIELGDQLEGEDCILTTGVGNHQMVAAQHFTWNYPQRLITSGSLGTMGVGLPFAIGSYFASPSSTILCIDGDGSFMMSLQELATISQYNIPIKIFILDNQKLQMVHTWQELFHEGRYITTELKNPHFRTIGKAFGIKTFSCSSKKKLKEVISNVLETKGPVLCHLHILPEHCLPFVSPGSSLDDFLYDSSFNKSKGIGPRSKK